jgi:uncharacterized membrane protein
MKYGWLIFVAGAALSWGAYVPTIHHGQLGFGGANRALRAFLFVGLAYCLAAVVVPALWLKLSPDHASFTARGAGISTLAGILGASGALCVIFALKSGGSPLYVAPLVFGGAPLVNALVAWLWDRPKSPPHLLFFVGILLVGVGAALVLRYRPADPPPQPAAQRDNATP